MKTCSKCRVELPLSEFHKNGPGGYRSRCRACEAINNAARYAAHPEKKRAAVARWRAAHLEEARASNAAHHLDRKYGMTPAARAEMLEQQGGLCPNGCGLPATVIDHCHDCENINRRGSVRGFLCLKCNTNLDHIARFSPTHAAYLARHDAICPALAVDLVA